MNYNENIFLINHSNKIINKFFLKSKIKIIWEINIEGDQFFFKLIQKVFSKKIKFFVNQNIILKDVIKKHKKFKYKFSLYNKNFNIIQNKSSYDLYFENKNVLDFNIKNVFQNSTLIGQNYKRFHKIKEFKDKEYKNYANELERNNNNNYDFLY